MGKTSAKVKNRYGAKTYDRIYYIVKKGRKDVYKEEAQKRGLSLNAFITECVEKELKK